MGLARYARKRRISPFCQEYVARTVMPSRVSRKLANPKIRDEQEIRPMQIQVNTSTAILNGENINDVRFKYDKAMKKYVERHLWDD